MVLSDREIKDMITHKHSLVEPCNFDNIGPASIDLTLADDFVDESGVRTRLEDGLNAFNILPGEFWLMSTKETINVPNNMVAVVKGKSSLARKGLMIECAGFIDPSFSGQITLEVKNLNKEKILSLTPGMKICQVVFLKMNEPAENPYSAENGHHYQNQKGTTRAWDADIEEGLTTKQENSFLGEKVDSIFNDMEKIQTAIEHLQFDMDYLGTSYNLSEHEDLHQASELVKIGLMDSHDKISFAMECMEQLESKLYGKGWLGKSGGDNDGR